MSFQKRVNGNLIFTVRITLTPEQDDDIIDLFLDAPPGKLANIIRETLRSGMITTFEDDIEESDLLEMDVWEI
jgi:hypothetical protein